MDLALTFVSSPSADGSLGIRVMVPEAVAVPEALFDVLAKGLRFPWYFGYNWDALWDCIQDLSWLGPGAVQIQHCDIPLVGDARAAAAYLGILNDSVNSWRTRGGHDLAAIFP